MLNTASISIVLTNFTQFQRYKNGSGWDDVAFFQSLTLRMKKDLISMTKLTNLRIISALPNGTLAWKLPAEVSESDFSAEVYLHCDFVQLRSLGWERKWIYVEV